MELAPMHLLKTMHCDYKNVSLIPYFKNLLYYYRIGKNIICNLTEMLRLFPMQFL